MGLMHVSEMDDISHAGCRRSIGIPPSQSNWPKSHFSAGCASSPGDQQSDVARERLHATRATILLDASGMDAHSGR